MKKTPIEQRFWSKVDKTGDCWLWLAYRDKKGYGLFRGHKVKEETAHRVAYRLAYGSFDEQLQVLHKCDNPPCVRPSHLFLGTIQDNMRDMDSKGRRQILRGEDNSMAVLTWKQVREIRERYTRGERYFGRDYPVSSHAIWKIIKNKSWIEEPALAS